MNCSPTVTRPPLYLFLITHFVANTERLVGLSYPVGWLTCAIVEVTYFYFRWVRKNDPEKLSEV